MLIKIDCELAHDLSLNESELFKKLSADDDIKEHSLEMHFPFIYKIFKNENIKILPVQVGHFSDDVKRKEAARILSSLIPSLKFNDDVVFVISSDFCHYGNRFDYTPCFKNSKLNYSENISRMDKEGFDALNSEDPIKCFTYYLNTTGNTICGREPILLFLELLKLYKIEGKWNLIDYAQSNFITSLNDSSVSYLSAVFYQDA